MPNNDYIKSLLNLPEVNFLDVQESLDHSSVTCFFEPPKKPLHYPDCGHETMKIHDYRTFVSESRKSLALPDENTSRRAAGYC